MAPNQANTIYPCPFSKSYGIPIDQAWSLLKVVFIYRFIVSSLFLILFYSQSGPSLLGVYDNRLYEYSSQGYSFFSLLSGLCIFWRVIGYTSQAQLIIFTDIIFITLLMHASGGIHSGIGILLAVSIASGGLLIGGRCALLFAALASLSILTEQLYAIRTDEFVRTSLSYAGILGALFFTIAYLSYVFAKRAEQSEKLASQHQQTISNLEELNKYIIQHLRSGIIISNSAQQIKMCNEAALSFINEGDNTKQPVMLADFSNLLSYRFQRWLDDISQDVATIRLRNQFEVQIRFSLINTDQEIFHMIIMEDVSLYNQKLQQSKLVSLGRLSASIAHEIRNPLGAISHASQLLAETPALSVQDQRLTEIIQSHCLRVNKIIEDVLQVSRRHPSKKEKIALNSWIQNYLQNFILATGCDSNSFKIDDKTKELWVYMDAGHLKQILDNLCTNALKYGNTEAGEVTIEISILDKHPCIKILDNGAEIDSDIVNHLFEPFYTTSTTGTGLGLYISKELAELNQAKLNYAITNHESCFKLCLPTADDTIIEI